ncbi:hypothetical protein [Curtobacterium sp. MCBD17_008]|uniref:hypothetical protein n=1 Tax=Curtobacterium sp. MCBD17_008 TaxID=2175656 RepID=UPI000DA81379|nr:hypothetical protein [Curtobacterium sp. MCBD17_008]PZE92498.1 hypothetical protein DEI95_08215 [Curtobacterium sp. MCBD17_008]
MDHETPVVTEPSAGHHHHDAGALASGDPFTLMPPIWPLLFGEPHAAPSVVHLTTNAPPLAFPAASLSRRQS